MMRMVKSGTDTMFNRARQTPWLKTDNLIFRRSLSQDILCEQKTSENSRLFFILSRTTSQHDAMAVTADMR